MQRSPHEIVARKSQENAERRRSVPGHSGRPSDLQALRGAKPLTGKIGGRPAAERLLSGFHTKTYSDPSRCRPPLTGWPPRPSITIFQRSGDRHQRNPARVRGFHSSFASRDSEWQDKDLVHPLRPPPEHDKGHDRLSASRVCLGRVARSGRFELPTPRFVVWWLTVSSC